MSLRTNDEELPAAHPNRGAWICLAVAAVAVAISVFGFLHAGRSFWQVSSVTDTAGFFRQV